MLYGDMDELEEVYRHCSPEGRFQSELWATYAFKDLFPLWMLKYLPNMAACHISIVHDARGPNNSIVEGGASSLLAISEAASVIERGHADAMLAGGSGSMCVVQLLAVSRLGPSLQVAGRAGRRLRARSRPSVPAWCWAKARG